jgi:hypothetical protein
MFIEKIKSIWNSRKTRRKGGGDMEAWYLKYLEVTSMTRVSPVERLRAYTGNPTV